MDIAKMAITKRKIIAILLVVIILVMGAYVAYTKIYYQNPLHQFTQQQKAFAQLGGDAELQTASGNVRLSDIWSNKVVALYFGFARCPDICPTSLAMMQSALLQLSPQQRDTIQVIFVSVDPEYDTIDTIEDYVRFFVPAGIGAITSLQKTHQMARQYGAYIQKIPLENSALSYTVDHSTRWYLLTKQGEIGTMLEHNLPPHQIASTLALFTKQYL